MELKLVLEAILFAAQKPLSPAELRAILAAAGESADTAAARAFQKAKAEDVEAALDELAREHAQAGRSFRLGCVAGAWQFVSEPEYAPWLKVLAGERMRPARLSLPALETLAIIAYRQPITRAEIEQIRGVSVDGVMQTLLERGLVEPVGRAEIVGHPLTYGATKLFLEYFGLRSLEELPAADELRRLPVERPPGLLTVQPGLATLPPEQLGRPPAAAPAPAPPATAAAKPAPPVSASTEADQAQAPAGETNPIDEHPPASQDH
jgi:segregation and condensation protein B